ncbi:MAG: hypothetical protein R2822_29550 [Spirosomataceae bacterium]
MLIRLSQRLFYAVMIISGKTVDNYYAYDDGTAKRSISIEPWGVRQ